MSYFTEGEKVRVRYHMGYTNVASQDTFVLGVPAAVQTQFMIEGAMNRLPIAAMGLARELIAKLDAIDVLMFESADLTQVSAIDEITVEPKMRLKQLDYYEQYAESLGNLLGVPRNPYDRRFVGGGANVPVSHG